MFVWWKRLEMLTGLPIGETNAHKYRIRAWKKQSTEAIEAIAAGHGACYILDFKASGHRYEGEVVAEDILGRRVWQLWRLTEC